MSSSGSDGIVGPETARAIGTGRESLGVVLRAAQERLQHVFIAFVVGLLGGIFLMRLYLWPALEADLLASEASVIAQTPFDVILMQVKIGLFAGVGAAIPVLLYHARKPLRERGIIPDVTVKRWHVAVVGLLCLGLATLGVLYAYFLFFPLMFQFLAGNAVGAGLAPKYSIVKWTEFIFFLGLSFALAAQLPLLMGALSYSGVVPYETFRDKWKYAVMGIFAFGAFFSPPDPFTQILWATPLVLLYGLSLYLSKILVTTKRGREYVDVRGVFGEFWNRILGVAVLGFAGGYAAGMYGAVAAFNDGLSFIGSSVRVPTVAEVLGVPSETSYLILGVLLAVVALLAALLYYVYVAVDRAARVVAEQNRRPDPAAIDLDELDAAGVRGAPPEAFAALSEDEALATAQRALDDGDDEKAQLVLDRFDEVQEAAEEAAKAEGDGSAEGGEAGDDSNPVQSTAAGVMDAFTEEETTEDDIGGYYYDLRFIFSSLRSRAFHIVGTFMVVMVALFGWLYYGGFGNLRDDFIARIPAEVQPEAAAWPITLHPVEALVFQVKLSVVIAAIAVLPMIVYYLWPALSERGVVTGDRRTILVWGGSIVGALAAGSYLGYSYIAPEVISFLVYDALSEGMVISYTVSTFAWLIFLLTVGIGLLANIPVTMVLFHVGGVVSFETMRKRWRVPILAVFVFSSVVTPDSLYTMLIIAFPMVAMYLLGLGLLYLVTLGGRRGGSGRAVGE
jgi:sec-independent protein translocase protein TatC